MVCYKTDFIRFWLNFDQNNAKEGQPKFVNKGERVDFDGQINQKMYEIMS